MEKKILLVLYFTKHYQIFIIHLICFCHNNIVTLEFLQSNTTFELIGKL